MLDRQQRGYRQSFPEVELCRSCWLGFILIIRIVTWGIMLPVMYSFKQVCFICLFILEALVAVF